MPVPVLDDLDVCAHELRSLVISQPLYLKSAKFFCRIVAGSLAMILGAAPTTKRFPSPRCASAIQIVRLSIGLCSGCQRWPPKYFTDTAALLIDTDFARGGPP